MVKVSDKAWAKYKRIVQDFLDEDAGKQKIIWAKHIDQMLSHGEDYLSQYHYIEIEVLCYYNAFRNWPINESTTSGELDEENLSIMISRQYLNKLGYINENGIEIKLSLEEAAEKIGISKKSLDDYLIQLRIGKMFGFNFNEHKNDKVGILRAFVKKNKSYIENKFVSTDFFDSNKF